MSRTLEQIATVSPENDRALLEQVQKPKDSVPLSFAQQRLWFLDKLNPGSPAYNVPTILRLEGRIDLEAFRKGLDAVVKRHEALRTTFPVPDGNPIQRINAPRPVELPLVDLSHFDPLTRDEEAQRVINQAACRPFDLAEDLMVRGTLIRLGPRDHMLVLVIHHIASDEWSLRILFQEWAAYYEGFSEKREVSLADLPIQYSDFAQWQREWLNGDAFQEQLTYWREQLKGPLPVLQLPTDRPRPSTQTYRGALFEAELSKDISDRVKQFSRQERATLFMTLLAVFKVLLYRYTQQEDIVIGSPIAGRNRIELEPLVGFFVNTLALRSSLAGDLSFREFLRRVRETTLGAYANQDVPFDKLVEELHPERSSTHMPFIQVVFSLNTDSVESQPFPGIRSQSLEVDTGTAKFDLTCILQDRPRGLNLIFEYNTDLFDRERVDRMARHYQNLLAAILAAPEQKISELPLMSPAEERQVLVEWNNTASTYPRAQCIHQLFETQVACRPDAVAVEYGQQTITYRELNARANQLAHYLQELKVGPNTLVGVFMERSLEMIVAFTAILKAGSAYVPLDLSYPQERLAFMIEDTAMPVILSQANLAKNLPLHNARLVCLDSDWPSIADEPRRLPPNHAKPTNLAYIIYTSGSTGKPKGVAVPHHGVTRLVLNTNYIQIQPGERMAQASNASFDAATFEIWGALLNGACIVGISKETALTPAVFSHALKARKINTLFLTTALFNQLAREVPGVFSTLDNVLFGGEAVDPKWVRTVLEYRSPRRLLHVYGPTESTTFTSWFHISHLSDEATTVPIGKPISNTQLYILDQNRRPVPARVPGEIYVGGDGLARGYWNRPELTAEKFVPNPFRPGEMLYRTGDLACFDPEGNVEFIGRIDYQVKIRGFRIELGEIESLLARHPQVGNVVVTPREDLPGDKRLVAYIIPRGAAPSSSDLRAFLKAELPDYMIPAAFVLVDSFPLTPNEKVDRKALPPPEQNRPALSKTFIAPRDQTEQQLANIWEKTLGVQPIGAADNFFELGGHSLLAVRLFSQIEKVFHKKLPLATLFRAPTIEEIARVLRQESSAKGWSTLVDIQPKGSQTPFFWIHSLGGDGGGGFFYYRELAELLGPDQPSFGIRSPRQPFSRIEEMAAFYISEIKNFQPQGPYHLGGFCFGGVVAYEMSRQLLENGEPVGVLAILESSAPNLEPKQNWTPATAMHSLENLVENVKDFVTQSPQNQMAFVKEKSHRLRKKLRDKLGVQTSEGKIELKDVLDLSNYPRDYVTYAEAHWEALTRYKPKPSAATLHLFRARKQGLSNFSHTLGWDALVDDRVSVTVIPGTHESMLQEPNVQILAAKLRSLLEDSHHSQREHARVTA